jgi:UDP-2-acetamido-2,6-beta-L-arabino-hexul-4-ose reductase
MKIVITGAQGLLGWHSAARLHADNCAARYRGDHAPWTLALLDRAAFGDDDALSNALAGADVVLHWAGVNRGSDSEVAVGNPAIAQRLVDFCAKADASPFIVYANSTHAGSDTVYGRSKKEAGDLIAAFSDGAFCDFVLPHIFAELARPYYNNVTATFIDQIWKGEKPSINPEGRVELLHAGEGARIAIEAALERRAGTLRPQGRVISVVDLWDRLVGFHEDYAAGIFPDLADPFDLALFNSYRTAAYPHRYPMPLTVNADNRGILFESAKARGSGHAFLSTTKPGIIRGDHFHSSLVERFVVVSGEAVIRVRKVLSDEVHEFFVSGEEPVAIDQIPFHTHHIQNLGDSDLITFFWSHRIFDRANPDTYQDPVIGNI